jgi:hypothetical protein
MFAILSKNRNFSRSRPINIIQTSTEPTVDQKLMISGNSHEKNIYHGLLTTDTKHGSFSENDHAQKITKYITARCSDTIKE